VAGNLTRDEAAERGRRLAVGSYTVDLDLTGGPDRFRSTTAIRFRCADPGPGTFCELSDAELVSATLNGSPLPADCYDAGTGRLALPGLIAENELRVVADCAYTRTGQGLHRFTDPVDGQVFLYTQCAPADACRLFACFDQPDLKASFRFMVTAPDGWEVVTNTAGAAAEPVAGARRWTFGPTKPLPTYLVEVAAGPYHRVSGEYLGTGDQRIPLGLYCRPSLAPYLDAEALFDVTRRGFDFYQRAFGMSYPFGKYDQLFVPEMRSFAAMEHPGAVTFQDEYLFRSRVTDASYERRANTVLHEMAHMWFGNLVTMRWWEDTWLNESFATYAATLAQTSATRWTGAWATFADSYKSRAGRQDQLPSTHPVSADIPDIRSMEVNFDGITYYKGASVLKQLVAAIGQDDFLAALRTYFRRHAYGNTTLADLLAVLTEQSGRDLSGWSREWLETAGPNTLRPAFTLDGADRFASFAVAQSAPAEHPTLRTHRLAIGLYDATPAGLVRRTRTELDVAGPVTEVPELYGARRPDLVLINDDDLTYAKIRLDDGSLRTLRDSIGGFTDPLPQAVCWTIAWDMTRDGDLPARDYAALVRAGVPSVGGASVVRALLDQARQAVTQYTAPAWRTAGVPAHAAALRALARDAEPGGDRQLAYAQAFAAVASSPDQLDVVAALLAGAEPLPGLAVDTDLRWILLRRLAVYGRAGAADIDAELTRDPTAGGQRSAATCRAAIATAGAKAAAWDRVTAGSSLSTAQVAATLEGFREPAHADLLAPYTRRYFATLAAVADSWPTELTQAFARAAYPATDESPTTLASTDAYLAAAAPAPWLRRLVTEARADLARALHAQSRDAEGNVVGS
jgi:aminopeptidase N